jgi:hypothetical protein
MEPSSPPANANNATKPAANVQMKRARSVQPALQDTFSVEPTVSVNAKMANIRTPQLEHAMLAAANAVSAQMQKHAQPAHPAKSSKAQLARLRKIINFQVK